MSKEKHTPTAISKYIDREITDIRIKVYSGVPYDEIEHRLHGLNLSIIDKLGKAQSNHDKLVEALESIVITINSHTYPLGQKGVKVIEEAKQLLTELKS